MSQNPVSVYKFHEFPIELAISRWWLPDLGHTLISAVKRKHGLDWFNAPLVSSPEVKRLREDEVPLFGGLRFLA